ncbi:alpha/beta fold hydrolase [Streptomyces tropicalis]|uniref:Alpha/beta hydrolase n=1 Tax=Streptomyces tropicalis TaxID=3034234 RepID=A0ABT6A9U2_9ACTN|nr:alpha/beta hydrolase [Streptomyces tropicalis]MDF3301421.1 alpha/beta hydrolase [Streptomyces tropicalis]
MTRTAMPTGAQWAAGGTRTTVRGRTRTHVLFVRQDGPADGTPVTLVHGFPTSSHDWSPIVPGLAARGHRVTTLDLLGFGHSDKPRGHAYSVLEQADLVEEVWRGLGIGDTALVAHDYGVSVAQELLARDPGRVTRSAWLNGGLYPDLHRPIRVQRLLHGRLGPVLARAVSERGFRASMRKVMSRPVSDRDLHLMWENVALDGGRLLAPRLLRYIDERRAHEARWVPALEGCPGPMLFVWGPADPISGAHVLARVRERMPHAVVHELSGPPAVGHYPQVEAPDEVEALLGDFLAAD